MAASIIILMGVLLVAGVSYMAIVDCRLSGVNQVRPSADYGKIEAQLRTFLDKAVCCRKCGGRAVLGRCDAAFQPYVFTLQCVSHPACFNSESAKWLDYALERWNQNNAQRCRVCGR